jgi:Nucleotide modification associated domain 1
MTALQDFNGPNTSEEYQAVIERCKSLFLKKTTDYGTSWRIMRLHSITDQIFIKAKRIRSIQEKGQQLIEDDIAGEFIAIINYCVIALMQLKLGTSDKQDDLAVDVVNNLFELEVSTNKELLFKKNHDYGEAWRDMRISSITDIILMKLLRIKQIEDNLGQTIASEGVEGSYRDMLNYAVFCLILMEN